MDTRVPLPDHLSAEQLAAYVGRSLSPDEQAAAVEHLAGCPQCRDEALATARVLRSERTRKVTRVGASVATVAVLAVAVVVYSPSTPTGSTELILRDGDPASAPASIGVHAPLSTAEAGVIVFSWQSVGPDVRYRFSLTRSDGSEVWNGGTVDTTLILPPDVALSAGETYFWWVDALLLDGRSVTTDVQPLTIVP